MKKRVLIGCLVIIIGIIFIIFGILNHNKLNENSDLIKEIYNYIGNNDLQLCGGLKTYDSKEVKASDIENDTKLCMAYNLLKEEDRDTIKLDQMKNKKTCSLNNEIIFATDNYEDEICTLKKIDKSTINNQFKKMYGYSIESYDDFQIDGVTQCYFKDDAYYCGLSEKFTYTIGAEPHTYRSIKNVKTKNDELYIYDYFLKVVNNECYSSYIGDEKIEACTKNYDDDKVNYKFLKKYGTIYKHTFKKSGDSYYWEKSEPIK